jgi:hypothetical protein
MSNFKKFIPVIVIVLLFFIIFSLRSRFANVGQTLADADGKYEVQINFSYNNPTTFNGNWNGLILYLENVENTTEPTKAQIFSNTNLFYGIYYNNTSKVGNSTTQSAYTTWITTGTKRETILTDTTFKSKIETELLKDTRNSTDTNIQYLYDFIRKYYAGDDKLYTEQSGNLLKTASSTGIKLATSENLGLKLLPGKYKFSVGIINNKLIINTKDYSFFPFTCSTLKSVILDISTNVISNPSESPDGLTAYVTFL